MEIDGSKKVTKVTDKERSTLDESQRNMDLDPKVKMLKDIIGCLAMPVFALKDDLSLIALNQGMEELTGYNMGEARGKDLSEIFDSPMARKQKIMVETLSAGNTYTIEKTEVFNKSGKTSTVKASLKPMFGEDGQFIAVIGSIHQTGSSTSDAAREAMKALVADAEMLSKAAVEGRLSTRADVTKHQGDFRKIVQGVNDTLDAVIGPLNVAAKYVDDISKGAIPAKITDTYNGDFNVIKNNLNQCIDVVNNLVADAGMLSKAAVEGRLATRADASKHQGDYRKIVQGVNDTLDAVIGPLNVSAKYVDDISKGAIPAKITDTYNGDFNVIKNNLNQCIDVVNNLVADAVMLSKAAVEGKLATRADASKHQGDYKKIVQGVNDTLDAVIGPLNVAAKYVDDISKGAIPAKITDNYNGDFNVIKTNLNQAIDAVNKLVADAGMLSKAAVDGKLATRADATKHQGDYRKIVQGVNDTLDAVIGPLNVSAKYVDDISKGAIPAKITDNYNGDFNVIKTNLNQCIDAVNNLVADAGMLSKAAVEGKLATRADASKHQGDYRKIVQGVNDCLDAVIGPLNVAAKYVDDISKGAIPAKITDNYNGDFNVIKNNLNQAIDAVNNLVADAGMLSKAAVDGKLATRADATKHRGDYKKIVQGVNDTLDAVIGPLNVAAKYVDDISKGAIPAKITDNYNGDFNTIKNNLNLAIDAVNALVADAGILSKAAVEGRLATRADASKHQGDYRKIVQGVNDTLDAVIGPLNVSAKYVDEISKGAIPAKITDNYNGDFNTIKNNLNQCIDAVNALVADAGMLSKAAIEGKLATRADATKHRGDYRKIVEGVNGTLDAVIGPLNVAAKYVDDISKGAIPAKITDTYNGDFNVIKNNLNQCIDAVNNLVADAVMLSKAAVEGKLATRADASKHQGDYRKIVQGVNDTLDSVIIPINEAMRIADSYAGGDLTARVEIETQGDFTRFAQSLDKIGTSMVDLLTQVNESIDVVAATSQELSSSAQEMNASTEQVSAAIQQISKGAQNQATQVDDAAEVMKEMSTSVTEVVNKANMASQAAGKANDSAGTGKIAVDKTVTKMKEISQVVDESAKVIEILGKRSEEIGEIVSVITGISDQTNLLALNAAIEAARAGEQGRGFAVVAEEVKNLAEDSREAAERIAKMIKEVQSETAKAVESMKRGTKTAAEGLMIVDETGKAFTEISIMAAETSKEVATISAMMEKQKEGQQKAAKSVDGIAAVAEETASASEESASSTEELTASMEDMTARAQSLSEMALNLKKVAGQFKIGEESKEAMKPRAEAPRSQSTVPKPAAKRVVGKVDEQKVPAKVREALSKRNVGTASG